MVVENKILLFDGLCNLCNKSVIFIIRHNKSASIFFSSLQSNYSQDLIIKYKLPKMELSTIFYIDNGKIYTKSTAWLKIFLQLDGLWPSLYLLIIFPRFLRNYIYDIIAKNRYTFFGKRDSCLIPSEQIKNRFL